MYQIGEQVVYGIHGVCRVADQEERTVDRKQVVYLALEPLEQAGARFLIPTHNPAAMSKVRPILTKEQLTQLMESEQVLEDGWIQDENRRKQAYRELISGADQVRLMQMVRSLYRHKKQQLSAGRKVHMCDDNFLRDAEKLLSGEIAVVLGMDQNAAREYLRSKLKEDT